MVRILLAAILLFSQFPKVKALELEPTEITTSEIAESFSFDPSCLNYCITGICVWLRCSIYECEIDTSVRVRHFNPDLVVSVFDEPGDNPWQEAAELFGELEEGVAESIVGSFHDAFVGGGHRVEGGNTATDHSLRFKEATAVGHPLSSFVGSFGNGYYCPSEAESFEPYFSSSVDAFTWRLGLPEFLYIQNLLPGVRVVGSGVQQQWGPIWTRTGFINQKDDTKAAAVVAQRVGNIVTQTGQPHVYIALNGNGYNKTWLPGELVENDPDTGVWQMLAPKMDQQCYAFGENDVYNQAWSQGRHSEDNRYAFSLWRPYQCCEAKGIYLFTVPFEICL